MKESNQNLLEDLMRQYSFDQLSQEDKSFVLSNISEEEYRAYQTIIAAAGTVATPTVPPSVKESLTKEFGRLHQSNGTIFQKIFSFKIPLWLVTLLAAALAFWYYLSSEDKPVQEVEMAQQQVEPKIIYRTDTIYKEIKSEPIVITKEVEKIIYVDRVVEASANEVPQPNRSLASDFEQSEYNMETNFFSDVDINELSIQKQQGRSVSQDAAIMNILDDIESQVTMK